MNSKHLPGVLIRCTRCGELINDPTVVWLELNWRTHEYSAANAAPLSEADSQGCFPFGPDCAKHPNKPYKAARTNR